MSETNDPPSSAQQSLDEGDQQLLPPTIFTSQIAYVWQRSQMTCKWPLFIEFGSLFRTRFFYANQNLNHNDNFRSLLTTTRFGYGVLSYLHQGLNQHQKGLS